MRLMRSIAGVVKILSYFAIGVCRKIVALATLPLNVLLNNYKNIPHPPPYSSFSLDVLYNFLWHFRFHTQKQDGLRRLDHWLRKKLVEQSRPYGPGNIINIARINVEDFNSKTWRGIYEGFPVVIDGLLKDSEALNLWSLDYFKRHYGSEKVHVTSYEASQDDKYTISSNQFISVEELVDNIRAGKKQGMTASSALFESDRRLLDILKLERIEKRFGEKIFKVDMFMSGEQTGSQFHSAAGGNAFCQIHGDKIWKMVSPKHTKWMYTDVGVTNNTTFFGSPINTAQYKDMEDVYPLFKYVPQYVAHLKPGDVLYVPPWWWHEITNIGETIGVPVRIMTKDIFSHLGFLTMISISPTMIDFLFPSLKVAINNDSRRNLILSDRAVANVVSTETRNDDHALK